MNTHTDGLCGNTCKRKTLMNLESAMPGVDQPSRWVDGRDVDKGVVIPLPIMAWSTALPHCSLFLSQTR